jgi:hypothetical protein
MTDHTTTETLEGLDQDYTSQVTLAASADVVFDALTTVEGLTGWWAPVTGNGLTGGELTFTFGPGAQAVMRVDAAERGVGVRWTPLSCVLEDWVGTTLRFDISPAEAGATDLRFCHAGLAQLECFDECKTSWDHFIVASLVAYVETGTGHPNGSAADLTRREARAQRQSANVG